jgi:protein O-GlcNAc transferase
LNSAADAMFQRALSLHRVGQLEEAGAHYRQALLLNPRHVQALNLTGVLALQANQPQLAAELIGKAILLDPRDAAAHASLGDAMLAMGRHQAAIDSYVTAIDLEPNFAAVHFNRGNAHRELNQHQAAAACYGRAIEINPDNAAAHNNRGISLHALEEYAAAIASFNTAIRLSPDDGGTYYNCANALRDLGDLDAAISFYDKAITRLPGSVDAHINRGSTLIRLKRYESAVAGFTQALAMSPMNAGAYNNLGAALHGLKRFAAAIANFDKAIALDPDYGHAHFNRANALRETGRYEAAVAGYHAAIAKKSDSEALYGLWLNARMRICDWEGMDDALAGLFSKIRGGELAAQPFHVLTLSDSASLQKLAAQIWARETCRVRSALPPIQKTARRDKIRIGYFSADFRDHPVAYLSAGLFENHDRSRFEVTAFSFGPGTEDPMRRRLQQSFDRFIDVTDKSDRDVALLSRTLDIDIAVDMSGYTEYCRPAIFAHRSAPLQIGYLGYVGTSGADYMEYLIADRTAVPEESRQHYVEKIIQLPHSFQANDAKRPVADRIYARADLGLPKTGMVFCCFNNSFKIAPATFSSWMRILKRVDGSVLWLLEDNAAAANNLRWQVAAAGVNPDRLVFAQRIGMPEHLARQRAADLFLDTLPYNAHTSASDALWVGLPVLTCLGQAFAGRVAAGLLRAIELPDLIATAPAQYEDLAVLLASEPKRLAEIKRRLIDNRLSTPLFDVQAYTRQLETAYAAIHERFHAGQPPEHLAVPVRPHGH